ncbi:MAG TPA: tetratricopeptide repeat protein [Candidatus Binatia bacterium]|nr:tetratricopeptide repeat protein [Candidatus Binatia bacterium]
MSQWVFDTSDRGFEADVIERSQQVPVVIDFWAPWCGPCRTLGPLLERLADESGGAFVLAKVNVDENPGLAQAFAVSSIPMVLGLREGQVAAEFVGALPESGVRQFLSQLLPSEADQVTAEGEALRQAGNLDAAAERFHHALALDSRCDRALVGLAAVLSKQQHDDDALALLDRVAPGTPARTEADRIAAAIRIRQTTGADEAGLRAKLANDPNDLETRFALAHVLAASARYGEALDMYLEIVGRDRAFRDDGARKAMLDIYELLGSESEIVQRSRSALSRVLFR